MTNQSPPTIGVTCSDIVFNKHPPRLGQNVAYIRALIRAGAAPLLIPHLPDRTLLRSLYDRTDGLLLPGGIDVDPAQYGETRHEKCGPISANRDRTELALTHWAMEGGKPLLAICRGIQVLNVALGGSLYQDIQAQVPDADKHDWYPGYPRDRLSHPVAVTPETQLAVILDETSLMANSLHHQALKDVPPALNVVARAPDGIVEAVEAQGHPFALGVQWHPEELASHDTMAQRLFGVFVEASAGYA